MRDGDENLGDVLRQDEYTPQQLAELLEMTSYQITSAVYDGRLKATVIGSDIVSIRREDVLKWLRESEG